MLNINATTHRMVKVESTTNVLDVTTAAGHAEHGIFQVLHGLALTLRTSLLACCHAACLDGCRLHPANFSLEALVNALMRMHLQITVLRLGKHHELQ